MEPSAIPSALFQKGLQNRREVLGKDYVDNALATATDLTAPLQQLVTEWCWGVIWSRPGIDRKQRSFINLAMLTALNRPHEVRAHVRGAINNGVTAEEIREIIMQAAIYCGVPAALDSMRVAVDVMRDMNAKGEASIEGV
jgi:4-carboxymuconolactone decarboxylase